MEGKMPLFRVPVSLRVPKKIKKNKKNKHLPPHIHFGSTALLQNLCKTPACKNRSATESEWGTAAHKHVCAYRNVSTQRKMRARSVYAHISHPRCSRAGSPPICVMTCRLTLAQTFMSLLIASVYSQASLRARRGWVGGWGVRASHRYTIGTERDSERERFLPHVWGKENVFTVQLSWQAETL